MTFETALLRGNRFPSSQPLFIRLDLPLDFHKMAEVSFRYQLKLLSLTDLGKSNSYSFKRLLAASRTRLHVGHAATLSYSNHKTRRVYISPPTRMGWRDPPTPKNNFSERVSNAIYSVYTLFTLLSTSS